MHDCPKSLVPQMTPQHTGMVDMTHIMHVLEEKDRVAATEQQERQSVRDLGTADEAFRVNGVPPTNKGRELFA